jgi:hypothetical protein
MEKNKINIIYSPIGSTLAAQAYLKKPLKIEILMLQTHY